MSHLPPRSTSIGTPLDVDEPVALLNSKPSIGAKTQSLRSTSIGSSFFNKDGLASFLTPGDTSSHSFDEDSSPNDTTDSGEPPQPIASAGDLDLVGALGNLDLDDDFSKRHGAQLLGQPHYQQFYGGSLTPNPSVGGFVPFPQQSQTPQSAWSSTFVPSSAPPFSYNNPTNPDLLSVKPFELPEEDKAPFQAPGGFGGVLDNSVPFVPYGLNYKEPDEQPQTFQRYDAPMDDNMAAAVAAAQMGPMWNQLSIRGQYFDRMASAPPQNNHRYNNRRNQSLMNVHRKMHNNRRKGDDALKYANAKLESFVGEIYSLCKDQHGCRFLQRQLDLGREQGSTDVASTMIFNEIYLKIVELMVDPFGNYLIQKLFENVSVDQRIILVKNAAPEFIRIALDPHGTRALQKLVECISTEEESRYVVELLSPHIVSLSRDLNGNHVVQKCLQKLKAEDNQFIFDTASSHCNEIATHRHGCCVLQRCLDHGNASQRKQLLFEVAENATNLSLDPFGNYVVQYVLSRGDEDSIKVILDHIKCNIVSLSLHKFGSNVIEKSLRINKLTDTLVVELLANKHRFEELLNDAYGNYVLQTSLDVANKDHLAKLSLALQPLLPSIKNTPHGRRIMTKIQSIL